MFPKKIKFFILFLLLTVPAALGAVWCAKHAYRYHLVNVQVSSEGQSQQQQQSGHQQEEVSAALQLDDAPQFQQNESVLIKV